ncbi:hypothetical protein [Halostagnicola larsenii]|nr:hypothetical protein [Halostagnicola larsenii]
MASKYGNQSSVITAVGLLFALIAIVGTQFLGWDWGTDQLVPTLIGVVAAGAAILVVSRRLLT